MRITQLDLRDYGHLHAASLDLEHPDGSVRMVVGPNEAGKSTVRAAIRAVLFGHPSGGRGRVGSAEIIARITAPDRDTPMSIVRRARGPLEIDGERSLDDAEVAALLPCGVTVFDQLFLLDHDTLRRHAQTLLQADGGLGMLVFGASLGGGAVEQIGDTLDAQIAALVRPRSDSALINRALARLAAFDARASEEIVPAVEWARERETLTALKRRLDENADRRRELERQQQLLKDIRASADARLQHGEATASIAALRARGVCLDADDLERLRAAQTRVGELTQERERIDTDIARLRVQRDSMRVDEELGRHFGEIEQIYSQRGRYDELRAKVDAAHRSLRDEDRLTHGEAIQGALVDLEPLRQVALDTERRLAESSAALVVLEHRRDRLGLDHVPIGQLASLAVPSVDDIDAADARHRRNLELDERLTHDIDDLTLKLSGLQNELEEATRGAAVPSVADIEEMRSRRDDAWRSIRAWFVDGTRSSRDPHDDTAIGVDDVDDAPGAELRLPRVGATEAFADDGAGRDRAATEFEARVADVDALVDAALDDLDRLVTVQRVRAAIDDAQAKLDRLRDESAAQTASAADERTRWQQLWEPVSVRAGRPDEMRGWVQEWQTLVGELDAHASEHATLMLAAARIDEGRDRLRHALSLNQVPWHDDEGFLALLARAQRQMEVHVADATARVELDEALAQMRQLERRLEPLRALLGTPRDLAVTDAIARLHEQAGQNQDAASKRRLRDADIESQLAERERLESELVNASAHLERECEQHGIDIEHVDEVLHRSELLATSQADLAAAEKQLEAIAPGISAAELNARSVEVGGPDAVAARLDAIPTELEDLQHDRDRWKEEQGKARADHERSDGRDTGAALRDEIEATLSEIGQAADEAAVLSLAREMLRAVVERAGRGGGGALAARASEYFALLTDGEFDGVDVEVRDEQVYAVALRASGERLYPPSLSDGTLDQLWLAWRLAGIEHHIERVGAVPVIVDDALVHFDDGRAAAAFRAFAALARRTQVVVLTHHRHLVDVARDELGESRVLVTELGARSAGPVSVVQRLEVHEVRVEPLPLPLAPKETVRVDNEPRLLEALDDQWRAKADLIERSKIAPGSWAHTIKSLLEAGLAHRQGAGRGVRYRRAVSENP